MKYCPKCGAECTDDANVCTKCGYVLNTGVTKKYDSTLDLIIKIFMIISCVCWGILLIPLAWCIPMTLNVCKKIKNNQEYGTALSVCTLIFVSTVSGILMLVRDNEK